DVLRRLGALRLWRPGWGSVHGRGSASVALCRQQWHQSHRSLSDIHRPPLEGQDQCGANSTAGGGQGETRTTARVSRACRRDVVRSLKGGTTCRRSGTSLEGASAAWWLRVASTATADRHGIVIVTAETSASWSVRICAAVRRDRVAACAQKRAARNPALLLGRPLGYGGLSSAPDLLPAARCSGCACVMAVESSAACAAHN